MANDEAARLLQMKEKVDQAETKVARLQGQLDGINERLKNEFGIKSLKQADAELAKLEKELDVSEAQFKTGIDELEKEFDKIQESLRGDSRQLN